LVVELQPHDSVPEDFVVEHDGARCMDQRGNGACVALDPVTRLCTIYAGRPQTCRDFNRGESLCRRILARQDTNPAGSRRGAETPRRSTELLATDSTD